MIQTSNRAALYARFSSDNQRSESIDAQIRAMTAYCAQRHIAIVEHNYLSCGGRNIRDAVNHQDIALRIGRNHIDNFHPGIVAA